MIRIEIKGLPPSSNNAYINIGHKRALTKVGTKYKNETIAHLAQHYREEMQLFKKNVAYMFFFQFYSPELLTKHYKPGGALNKYKKFDGGNLTKLLEDCIASAGAFDDSQTMTSIWQKKPATEERTVIHAWDLEEEGDPFDHDYILPRLANPK